MRRLIDKEISWERLDKSMKVQNIIVLSFLAVALLMISGCDAVKKSEMSVHDMWIQAAPKEQKNSSMYLTIQNGTGAPIVLTGVSANVSEFVELHTIDRNGENMVMRKVDGFSIPDQSALALKPGGAHIMLINLNQDLKAEETVPVTLHFKNGADMELIVTVKKMSDMIEE